MSLNGRLPAAIECLLFVADEPLSLPRLAEILEVSEAQVERALEKLQGENGVRGITVARVAGGYQLLSCPDFVDYVHKLREPRPDKLGRAALETLTIVAYRQPITRPEIDQLRGVNSAHTLDTLLSKRLIREAGRKKAPGRPFLYKTTDEFLRAFGLLDLSDLPALE